jgi:hypothetical protein
MIARVRGCVVAVAFRRLLVVLVALCGVLAAGGVVGAVVVVEAGSDRR